MSGSLPTQAAIVRAVKAALAPAVKMGWPVAGYKVTFSQGVPCVDVTLGAESPSASPINTGGSDAVEALRERMRGCHARRA